MIVHCWHQKKRGESTSHWNIVNTSCIWRTEKQVWCLSSASLIHNQGGRMENFSYSNNEYMNETTPAGCASSTVSSCSNCAWRHRPVTVTSANQHIKTDEFVGNRRLCAMKSSTLYQRLAHRCVLSLYVNVCVTSSLPLCYNHRWYGRVISDPTVT